MNKKTFIKILSANDVGATGAHQAGILVPKADIAFLEFLPALQQGIKNPDAWISCMDETGTVRKFRFVYYNNKLYDANGTRNEYRLTYMTTYLKEIGANQYDTIEMSRVDGEPFYMIRLIRQSRTDLSPVSAVVRIKIKSAWRRIH